MNKGARWRGLAATAAMLAVLAIVYAQAAQAAPVDFGAYLRAARDLRDGGSSYEVALTWRTARYATGSPQPQPTVETAYVYPPTLALALVPLTVLPVEVASAIWLAVLFGCILATAWCLAALLLPTRDGRFCLLVAALALGLVAFKPIRGALAFSKQVDPIILALLAAALLAFVRRRDGRAGLWLGLAVTIKPFLAVLASPLLWKRGYRVVAVAGLLAVGLGLVPLLALGLLGDYLAISAYYAGPAMGASPVSQSAWSFLLRTLTVQPYTAPLVEGSWLVGLLTTISRSRGRRLSSRRSNSGWPSRRCWSSARSPRSITWRTWRSASPRRWPPCYRPGTPRPAPAGLRSLRSRGPVPDAAGDAGHRVGLLPLLAGADHAAALVQHVPVPVRAAGGRRSRSGGAPLAVSTAPSSRRG